MPTENKVKVLVVDNERVIADTLTLILRLKGYEAATAYSGEEAVQAARVVKPDILLTDVIMGDLDGIQASILIQHELPNCRVILISGNQCTHDLLGTAQAAGYAFEILAKPAPPDEILNRLASPPDLGGVIPTFARMDGASQAMVS